ncbi:MAG: TonB family protein [Cyclobacteriaceae bacterium]|nr:TonB family protein [Cyclobacteriaceae bacterium]
MKKKPEMSDSEILQYMDFDALLRKHTRTTQTNRNKLLLKRGLLGVGGIVLIGLLWYTLSEGTISEALPEAVPVESESSVRPDAPQPVAPVQDDIITANDEQGTENQSAIQPLDEKASTKVPANKQPEVKKEVTEHPEYIYHQASPVDGYGSLYNYFSTALQYPSEAIADSVQGVVTLSFIINVSGKPEKIIIEDSPDDKLNQEAIRLIENMPLWNPATLNGNPVSSKLSIPITFQIISVKTKE